MPVKRSRTTVKDRSRANLVTISSSTKKGKSSGPVTISSKAIDRSAQTTKNKKLKYFSKLYKLLVNSLYRLVTQ